MPTEFFEVHTSLKFPAGMGVLFNWRFIEERNTPTTSRIDSYILVPINSDTVFAENCYFYVRSAHAKRGFFNVVDFDRFHNPNDTGNETNWALRGRWLIGFSEEEAEEWAKCFAEEWNAAEEKRLAEEVDA